ncbi:MAG: DinB family protein [Fimbriimonadales bacterium]
MEALAELWRFTRLRLDQAIADLDDTGLNWRLFEGAHSIAEYLYHVAGVELYWAHHLGGYTPSDEWEWGVLRCATDSFLREAPFPLPPSACTVEQVRRALERSAELFRPLIEHSTPEQLAQPVTSPIGDPITGREGLIRAAQHASYHTGQIWLMRMHPQFPNP